MDSWTLQTCPICKLTTAKAQERDAGERLPVECPCCGKFTITLSAIHIVEEKRINAKLSAWLRDRFKSGNTIQEINSYTIKDIEASLPNYRVAERQLLLLRAIEKRTDYPGQPVTLMLDTDFPLAWAKTLRNFSIS